MYLFFLIFSDFWVRIFIGFHTVFTLILKDSKIFFFHFYIFSTEKRGIIWVIIIIIIIRWEKKIYNTIYYRKISQYGNYEKIIKLSDSSQFGFSKISLIWNKVSNKKLYVLRYASHQKQIRFTKKTLWKQNLGEIYNWVKWRIKAELIKTSKLLKMAKNQNKVCIEAACVAMGGRLPISYSL